MAIRMSLEVRVDGDPVVLLPMPRLSREELKDWVKAIRLPSIGGLSLAIDPRRVSFALHHADAHRNGEAFASNSLDLLSNRVEELMTDV